MTPIFGSRGGGSAFGFGRNKHQGPSGPSAAPSSLSASPGYAGSSTTAQMSLSWTNGDALAKTEVYNGASLVTTANAGVTSYNVTGLNSNTSYSFTVKHIKNNIRSAASNTATNTTYVEYGANASYYCTGCDYRETYADGYGGTSDVLVQHYYQACGSGNSCCTPNGTLVNAYCSGRDYYTEYANGNCGTYTNVNYNDCSNCSCPSNDCSAGPGSAGGGPPWDGGGCSNDGYWDTVLSPGDCCSGTAWLSGPSYCCLPNWGGSYYGCFQNCGSPSTVCASFPYPYSC